MDTAQPQKVVTLAPGLYEVAEPLEINADKEPAFRRVYQSVTKRRPHTQIEGSGRFEPVLRLPDAGNG